MNKFLQAKSTSTSFGNKNGKSETQNHGLLKNFGWLLKSNDLQKNFCLGREDELYVDILAEQV